MSSRGIGVGAIAAAAVLAVGAGTAGAASVTFDTQPCTVDRGGCPAPSQTLEVRDTAAETNDLGIVREPDAVVVTDARTPLTAGRGCESVAPDRVRCPATPNGMAVTVDAGGGDDTVDAAGLGHLAAQPILLGGGPGNDVVLGSGGPDTLSGGGGADRLDGRAGLDTLRDDDRSGEAGPDLLEGGPGVDVVGYEGRTAGVTVDLAAGGPAGEPGERDTLIGLERVLGGSGGDVLHAPGGGEPDLGAVWGGAGNDRITGGGRLVGGPGDDRVEGGPGVDQLEGGGGRDRLLGGLGDDLLIDGDAIPQFPAPTPPADGDTLDGGPGRDVVSYAGRPAGVTVDLARAVGGGPGENDVLTGLEDVLGGGGGDVLAGDGGDNRLIADGTAGGFGGRVDLVARDRLIGRAGDDTLEGGEGPDRFSAGSGDDTILSGNAGDRTETVACGPGSDLVYVPDPRDLVRGCERAQLDQPLADGQPGSTIVSLPRPVLRRGRVLRLGVRCGPCDTRLRVTFLDPAGRAVGRSRRLRLRDRTTLVLRAPRRARTVRLLYVSPRVGIDTGLRVRLPAPPSAR